MSDISTTIAAVKIVTKRELNQQTAAVLAEVRAGDPVVVTERGLPRWRIEEADAADLDANAGLGLHVTRARAEPAEWPEVVEDVYSLVDIEQLSSWARGNR